MSGVKHTRGPWEVHSFDGEELNIIPDPDSEFPDTYLGICTINTWPGERSKRRSEANARLIAAAPDLLEALVVARTAIHQAYVDWDGEPEDAVPLQLARAKCDAAITRATGDRPEKGGAL